jgi:hypothetical protein
MGGDVTAYPGSLLNHLPGIHTWEAIGRAICPLFEDSTEGPTSPQDDPLASSGPSVHRLPAVSTTPTDSQFHSEECHFEPVKPHLSPGSMWHLARICSLVDACKGLRDLDLVCHLTVRQKYSPVVMTGTLSAPTKTHRFRRALGGIPVEHVSVPTRRSDRGLASQSYCTINLLPSSSLYKDGGRPVLLEFDGLPEIPKWRNVIPCIVSP